MRKQRSDHRQESASPRGAAKPAASRCRPHSTHPSAREAFESDLAQQIETCIEILCQKGCLSVRSDIRALEQGQDLPETAGLSREATRLVLQELKAIMSVYGDTCRIG